MGGSYRQCTECGKRALSIATRCPACGRELTAPPVKEEGGAVEWGRFLSPGVLKVVLAVVVVLTVVLLGRGGPSSGQQEGFRTDSAGASSEVGFSGRAAAGLDTMSAVGTAEHGGELLVARTWTHVRNARRVSSDIEAVLLPGDTVVADSLSRGWYRVALEGEVLGYAHRSTLLVPGRSGRAGERERER